VLAFLYDLERMVGGMSAPNYNCPFSAGGDAAMTCSAVRQYGQAKASLTVDMTNANADLTYEAKDYGQAGNSISVIHIDPSDVSQELAVSVDGVAITVSLATDGAGAITSTAAEVKAAVLALPAAVALVTVEDEGDGSGVVEAKAIGYLAGGEYHGCPSYNTETEECNVFAAYARSVRVAGGDTPDEG